MGKLVYSTVMNETNFIELELNKPNGLYFVSVISDEYEWNEKIIINN